MKKKLCILIFLLISIFSLSEEIKSKVIFITLEKNIDNKSFEENIFKYMREELAVKKITAENMSLLEDILAENNMTLSEMKENGLLKDSGVAGIYIIKIKKFRTYYNKVNKSLKTEIEISVKNMLNEKEAENGIYEIGESNNGEKSEEDLISETIKKTASQAALKITDGLEGMIRVQSQNKAEKVEEVRNKETVKKEEKKEIKPEPETGIKKEILLGKFMPDNEKILKLIPEKYLKYKRKMYINESLYDNLILMMDSAEKEGIKIKILSAWRSIEQQKYIWNNKWRDETLKLIKAKNNVPEEETAAHILAETDMPGISSYHWGSDIEIEIDDYDAEKNSAVYDWLKKNGEKYRFYQADERTKERWRNNDCAAVFAGDYVKKIGYGDIKDFNGYRNAEMLDVIEKKINVILDKK